MHGGCFIHAGCGLAAQVEPCTCERLCERLSDMSFICVVIGLHVGKAGQVKMQRRIGGLDSVQFWRCTGMAWLSLRLVSGLTRAELPAREEGFAFSTRRHVVPCKLRLRW